MNQILQEILRTGHAESADGTEKVAVHSQVPPEEGEFLRRLVAEVNPTVSLEVGCAFGVSALFICEGLSRGPATRHIVIDPYQLTGYRGIGLNNLKRAGFGDVVELHALPSHTALPQLEASGLRIDFAFIDGYHTFDFVLLDFFYIDRMLRVGGVVALDDADWPSIRQVCRYIATNRSYSVLRCLRPAGAAAAPPAGLGERLRRGAARLLPRLGRPPAPETAIADEELGLVPGSRCIAFRKEAEDDRRWDFHRAF
jgi:predicted O-methyltransferase YrrM